jgi:hypothetical protein
MNSRGLFFTVGAACLSAMLLSFTHAYSLEGTRDDTQNRLMCLERANSHSSNAADNLWRAFEASSALALSNTPAGRSVSGRLPNNVSAYVLSMRAVASAAERLTPNLSVAAPPHLSFTSDSGFNFTQDGDAASVFTIPYDTESVSVFAEIQGNVSSCNLTFTPGNTRFSVDFNGEYGSCLMSRNVNMSAETSLVVGDETATLTLSGGKLRLNGRGINYTVTHHPEAGFRPWHVSLPVRVSSDFGGCATSTNPSEVLV